MGYDAAVLLATVVFLPPVVGVAGLLAGLARWGRVLCSGWSTIAATGALTAAGLAGLYLFSAVQMLVIALHALQVRLLGRAGAGPASLRSYAHVGFQDPQDNWVYAVSPRRRAALRPQCRPEPAFPTSRGAERCTLAVMSDARSDAAIWLDGGQLHLMCGLH